MLAYKQLSGFGSPAILLPIFAGDPGKRDIRYTLFPLSLPSLSAQYFTSGRIAGDASNSW